MIGQMFKDVEKPDFQDVGPHLGWRGDEWSQPSLRIEQGNRMN